MSLPTQTQLMLPLLQSLEQHGGRAQPKEIYDEVADKAGVGPEQRARSIETNGRLINEYERRLRWTRQTAVLKGLISKGERSFWSLTDSARSKLGNIRRGTVLTFAISERGAFLWANAEDALAVIERHSVDLLLTSPPYPLLSPKEYGNPPAARWVDWMFELCGAWRDLLTPSGSIMLTVGPCWKPGLPAQQLHVERLLVQLEDQLGIHLLQRLDWHSPTKLPTPLHWVGIERLRVTSSVEPILWLSPNPHAKGDNRNVLRPYSPAGRRAIDAPRNSRRPSGFQFGDRSFRDCGGSIPPSLISAAPTGAEEGRYRRAMRAAGQSPHPAVLPAFVARFCILLATDRDDIVYDPFSGSGTVAVEAMKLGRKAIGSDRSHQYLEGGLVRCQTAGMPLEVAA